MNPSSTQAKPSNEQPTQNPQNKPDVKPATPQNDAEKKTDGSCSTKS